MSQSICILGRQPALGTAELESLFGAENISRLGTQAVLIEAEPQTVRLIRLGGSTRVARLLTYLPYTDWPKIEAYIAQELPKHVCCLPPGKIRFGISSFGLSVSAKQLNTSGLKLKKVIKEAGRSVRVIPNTTTELNSAQILHNQLTGPTGMELLLIRDGARTVLAQTTEGQDIEAYAARDQMRPKRDARVGMLPPKLAQIIVNLACPTQTPDTTVLDPFCGTGVLLQEALLMGMNAHGTDLEPRMIEYSQTNLEWLETKWKLENDKWKLAVGDATSTSWEPFSAIACETYLGRPFASEPKSEMLAEVMQDVDTIHRKFLKNVAKQTNPGFRMCIAVPAWNTKYGFKHLKTLDSLEELGYNRISFANVGTRDLIYYRENQVVGRELVTLIRK